MTLLLLPTGGAQIRARTGADTSLSSDTAIVRIALVQTAADASVTSDVAIRAILFARTAADTSLSSDVAVSSVVVPQRSRPSADIVTTGWSTAPLWSKINDQSDTTVITSTI